MKRCLSQVFLVRKSPNPPHPQQMASQGEYFERREIETKSNCLLL